MDGRNSKTRKPSPFGELTRRLESHMTPREEAIHLHLLIEQKRTQMLRLRQQMRALRSQLATLRREAVVAPYQREQSHTAPAAPTLPAEAPAASDSSHRNKAS